MNTPSIGAVVDAYITINGRGGDDGAYLPPLAGFMEPEDVQQVDPCGGSGEVVIEFGGVPIAVVPCPICGEEE